MERVYIQTDYFNVVAKISQVKMTINLLNLTNLFPQKL